MLTTIFVIGFLLCLIGFVISIKKEPRTILNGFLLETSIILLFFCFLTKATTGDLIFTVAQILMLLMYVIIFIMGVILIFKDYTHTPTALVSDYAKHHTISFYAPSKTFNLAGLIGSYHIVYDKYLKYRLDKYVFTK